ncbi:sigma-54 dependent transcriptional regulator [Desulfatiferula olefinivorans]
MNDALYPDFAVLLVDDEPSWLRSLAITLERSAGISHILTCTDSRKVTGILSESDVGLVLLDLNMPHLSGEDLLRQIREAFPEVQVIVVSGMNQVNLAVACMKEGAMDYIVKTQTGDRLTASVLNAVRRCELERENRFIKGLFLPGTLRHPEAFSEIVTRNGFMLSVFGYIEAVSRTNQPVLITGESGTGKELAARAVHTISRAGLPMVTVNVAGLDDTMFSDTLFGHTKGAFTGADHRRMGLIESAGSGTLFLDEIGDLSPASQVKLLRLIQNGEYYPVGSDTPKHSPARIVCSTHQDLLKKEKEGDYRKDLYYRLHTHHVHLPPLRERKDDIPLLLDHFMHLAAAETGRTVPARPRELIALLSAFHFPGNIRQLKAMVFDAVSTHGRGTLSMETFKKNMGLNRRTTPSGPPEAEPAAGSDANPFSTLDELPTLSESSAMLIREAMARSGGNQTLAARLLGISQPALSKRLKQMNRS